MSTCVTIVVRMSTYQRWFLSSPEKQDLVYLDEKGFNIVFPICEDTFAIIPQELEFAYCIIVYQDPSPPGVVLSKVPFSTWYCFQGVLA